MAEGTTQAGWAADQATGSAAGSQESDAAWPTYPETRAKGGWRADASVTTSGQRFRLLEAHRVRQEAETTHGHQVGFHTAAAASVLVAQAAAAAAERPADELPGEARAAPRARAVGAWAAHRPHHLKSCYSATLANEVLVRSSRERLIPHNKLRDELHTTAELAGYQSQIEVTGLFGPSPSSAAAPPEYSHSTATSRVDKDSFAHATQRSNVRGCALRTAKTAPRPRPRLV